MIFFLSSVILLLCIAIVYLLIDFLNEKKIFKKRIDALEEMILLISKKQILQSNQLKLSDDLNENLKRSKFILSNTIFDLNYELLDLLSKNDLLKK